MEGQSIEYPMYFSATPDLFMNAKELKIVLLRYKAPQMGDWGVEKGSFKESGRSTAI